MGGCILVGKERQRSYYMGAGVKNKPAKELVLF